MTILVTGGAGYIGSHTCVELIGRGQSVVIYDNFCNSHPGVIKRIEQITGVAPAVVNADVRDRDVLVKTLTTYGCDAVIHFAGLKAVGESTQDPIAYYDNNFTGSLRLIEAMQATGVTKLVFSSSATVYGEPQLLPLREDHPLLPFNPYGRTKLFVERLFTDAAAASGQLKLAILRYFNPVGAHESGFIGEDPRGIPNNLMPFVTQVAIGRRAQLSVFGNDYETRDGTGIRDYVHVMDLAQGHLRALDYLDEGGSVTVNLGTGHGTSVLELVHAFSDASKTKIPLVFAPRREGDVASLFASAELARQTLGWSAKRSLVDMCRDAWNWQCKNPNGYDDRS